MHSSTVSLRRRHLIMAGIAGAAAPAPLFAGPLSVAAVEADGSVPRLVVSGRILGGADRKPLAGATVEIRLAGAGGEISRAATDGDGRFFAAISPLDTAGRPRRIDYRVRHGGRDMSVTRRISSDLIANLGRDSAGALRTTFGLTLA